MKKICIITTVHQPFDIRIFHKQAKSLVQEGFDVSLIATHDKEEIIEDINIIPLPKSKTRIERMFINTFKALKLALKQDADIYHFHDPELLGIGLILKYLTHKPVIYDSHEYYEKSVLYSYWLPKWIRKPYSKFMLLYEKFVYPRLSAVIGVLDAQSTKFNLAKKFIALHNYPSLKMFENLQNHEKLYDLIYVGSISSERGLYQMLNIVSKYKELYDKNFKLCLLGKFPNDNLLNEYETYIKDNKLTNNIFYLGMKNQDEVLHYLSKSKIGLWLGKKTKQYNNPQLATKLFEYMAAELPVISTNYDYTMNHIGKVDYISFVEENDIDTQINIIHELLNNKESLYLKGKKAKEEFQKYYNWENESKKLLDLYAQLLKGT